MESKLTNPLSPEHFKEICKAGQKDACCRYVIAGPQGIECAKHTSLREILDRRVAAGEMIAKGDNCEGVLESNN